MRTSALFGEKTSDFSKFIVFRTERMGKEGEESFFRDIVWKFFTDAPNGFV